MLRWKIVATGNTNKLYMIETNFLSNLRCYENGSISKIQNDVENLNLKMRKVSKNYIHILVRVHEISKNYNNITSKCWYFAFQIKNLKKKVGILLKT